VQHHEVLHRGLPRGHQDHRQRAHPDEGAGRGQEVTDPLVWLGSKIGLRKIGLGNKDYDGRDEA